MEMKQYLHLRGLSSDAQVFLLLALTWSGFYLLQPCPSEIQAHVAVTFAVGADDQTRGGPSPSPKSGDTVITCKRTA